MGIEGVPHLYKLAHLVVSEYAREKAARSSYAMLGDRLEELVSVLVEAGVKTALKFDPAKLGPNYKPRSYLADKMRFAIEGNYYRKKSEGYGDRRYGFDNRIKLTGHKIDTLLEAGETAADDEHERMGDALEELAVGLSPSAEWTLRNLARPLADGAMITHAAHGAGLTLQRAKMRLEELREELAYAEDIRPTR
ncbi:MAG: hypothetical protein H0U00_12765 [Actinobacteria bacterium]|nr:hypothetical protein [Actinomycetota bacterium]